VHIGATRVIVSQESLLVDLLIVFARNFRLVLLVLTLVESRVAHVRVIGKTHDFRVRHLALTGHHRGWRGVVEVPIELQTVILVHYDASLGALGHPDLLAEHLLLLFVIFLLFVAAPVRLRARQIVNFRRWDADRVFVD